MYFIMDGLPLLLIHIIIFCAVVVLAVFFGIKARKYKKETSERTDATLALVLDNIPDIVFIKDMNKRYTYVNKAYLNFFNITESQIVGKLDTELPGIDEKTVQSFQNSDTYVLTNQIRYVVEETVELRDSGNPIFETVKTPLTLNGEAVGLIGVARDITRRKAIETEIRQHQQTAESANRLKTEFLSKVSHELRTPLSSIIGFVELSLDSEMAPKAQDYLKKIETSAEWLMDIINDLLDLSKVESGKIELENIPFDIHKVLASLQTMFLPQFAEKNLNFYLNEEPFNMDKLPLGDPGKLRQILQNLLSNAAKFTSSGVITLSSLVKNYSDGKLTMHFEVKDSGIGMTSEQVDKIFTPFTQADSSTTRKYGGTGLGLSIASNLVRLMGSRIIVESNVGEGSTFMFELTFDTVDKSEYIEVIEGEHVLFEKRMPIFDASVLLCEDNEMTRHMIYEHLVRVGVNVEVAENGKIGVEKILERASLNQTQFDLILMDIHMPVMDGKEAAKAIFSYGIDIPIVIVTANLLSNDFSKHSEEGFSGYLSKPFSSKELWHCLIKHLTPIGWHEQDQAYAAESDKALRQKLIQNFLKGGKGRAKEIAKALDSKDYDLAHRLAHTLKSNAGQLKAKKLQIIATDIEGKLKDSMNLVTPGLINELELELMAVVDELESEKISALPGETENDVDVSELLDTVGKLLNGRDAECLKYVEQLRKVPQSEALIEQMENFDFKVAYGTLNNILLRLGDYKHG